MDRKFFKGNSEISVSGRGIFTEAGNPGEELDRKKLNVAGRGL